MVSFPKHENYQSTGEEWLGDIPNHWQLLRTKSIFRLVAEPAPNNNDEELLSVYSDIGVKPRRELEERGNKASTTDGYWLVKKGDIIVNKLLAWMGAIGLSEYDGVTSPAYDILRAYKPINSKFYHYLFRNPICTNKLKKHSKGIMEMRLRLYFDEFGNIKIPYPPIEDQNRIVEFLDRKTAEIDQAIEQKQRLIKLLKEQKSILIDRAVTKGLNPNAPMRDSGIDWIGEIPAHWNFLQFKHCCKIIKDGLHLTPSKHNEGINFVSTQHVRNRKICLEEATYISEKDYRLGHPKVNPEAGDVLITLVGSIGFAALVTINHMPLSFTRHVGYVRCNSNKIVQEYLINYTESYIFTCFIEKNVSQTAQPSIYLGSLASHYLPLPPLEEQVEINQWLSRVIKPYSEMVETAVQHISMLQEMKQIFISQAVTGKLKI